MGLSSVFRTITSEQGHVGIQRKELEYSFVIMIEIIIDFFLNRKELFEIYWNVVEEQERRCSHLPDDNVWSLLLLPPEDHPVPFLQHELTHLPSAKVYPRTSRGWLH